MAVRRVLFCRQHNRKFRTLARLRNHFDIATLPRYDLAGQIQANAHALLFVYFFLTIEAPEDGGLDRKSTRLNSSHREKSRMPSSA